MIIGLSGYARSGKDTVAGILIGLHGYDTRSFAEPMRESLYKLNPIVHVTEGVFKLQGLVDAYGWDVAKVQYPEIRRLLQVFGTEVGREMFGEDFWVNQAFKDIERTDLIAFTDCRFPNEAQKVKEMGGEVWRIERTGIDAVNSHPSEHSLDDWEFDRYISNGGTLDDLKKTIKVTLDDVHG